MSDKIKRVDAIREMELRENKNGSVRLFSIQFYKQNGELVSLLHAKAAGLRANMKTNRIRGVQQTDKDGNPIGHIHTVSIDNIREFNHKKVTL